MTLTGSLPGEMPLLLQEFLTHGAIGHNELESAIGKLSFARTSICGRVGRAMLSTLYQKLNAEFYDINLSGRECATLHWRAIALLNITSRLTRGRGPVADPIIYTDAATTAQIIAAVIIDPGTFRSGNTRSEPLETGWATLETTFRIRLRNMRRGYISYLRYPF